MAKQKRKLYEDVHGVGPVGGSRSLEENGGRIPTKRVIDKESGEPMLVNEEDFDDELHEEASEDAEVAAAPAKKAKGKKADAAE